MLSNERPNIIAFFANAPGQGKTTAANVLVRERGYKLIRFADTLKAMTKTLLTETGMSEEHADAYLHDPELKNNGKPLEKVGLEEFTPRYIQRTLGTEWGRDCIHKNLWVFITTAQIAQAHAEGWPVVIDDMRFANELNTVLTLGGYTVHIHRSDGGDTGHVSEGAISPNAGHMRLFNHGSIEEFEESVLNTELAINKSREFAHG